MNAFENTKWVYHKKSPSAPSKRWGHSSTLLRNNIYIFGGKLDQESRKFNQCFYSLNCQDYTFQRLDISNTPQLRDSHTTFVVQDVLFIWGGCVNQEVSNNCFAFDGKDWVTVPQHGKVPLPRQSHISTILKNRFLLMYGGCRQQQIFNDFNIFDVKKRTWYSLKVLGQSCPVLQNSSLTLLNNQVYLFGGQSTLIPIQLSGGMSGESRQIYHNQLYKLELTSFDFGSKEHPPAIIINKVKIHNKPPVERAAHSAIAYQNRYLIIIGGQTYSKINYDNADLLNDVWSFDTQSNLWKQIKPSSSHLFKKHSNFAAVLYNEQIVIFGGLKSIDDCTSYDELLSLKLCDLEQYKMNNMCSVCKLVYKNATLNDQTVHDCLEYQQHSDTKNHKSNYRTIYKTAQLISHPFEAIRLLISTSYMLDASRLHIELKELSGKQMLFITDNSKRMEKSQFQWIISHSLTLKPQPFSITGQPNNYSYMKSLIDYAKYLKYGGFKLGKGVFASHINNKGEMVSVLTDDTVYYYFLEYHKQGKYYEIEKKSQYLNDYDMVKPLLQLIGQDESNVKNYTSRKVIYDLNSQNPTYLHKFQRASNDIKLVKNNNFKLYDNTYFQSLREFISTMFLEPVPLYISINNGDIIKYKNQASSYDTFQYSKISDCNLQLQTGLQLNIYYSPNVLNNDIKIYRNNINITRSRRHFRGEYSGYVIVPRNWQTNLFETGFENDTEFLYDAIDYLIKQHRSKMAQKQTKGEIEAMTTF